MKKKLILYNHYHNGDIFYSRILIEMLKDYFDLDYYHNMNTPLFSDLSEINEISRINPEFPESTSDIENGLVNTWIGQDSYIYLNKENVGCTFENYFKLSSDIALKLGIEISDQKIYLPKIYYQNLLDYERIVKTMETYKKNYQKIILISDGIFLSGQAPDFDFHNPIEEISKKYPEFLFITTHNKFSEIKNVIHSDTITLKRPDLLEIGLISKFCNVIIGRASGPYCFTQNEENMLDESKTFLCFSKNFNEGKYYQKMKSRFLWSSTDEEHKVIELIENSLT